MDLSTLTQVITQLGFPIVMVLALCMFIKSLWEKQAEQNEKREESLMQCLDKAQTANQKLSDVNAEFVKALQDNRNDIEEIKQDVSEIKLKLQ